MRKLRFILGLLFLLGGIVMILMGQLSVGLFSALIGYSVMEFLA